MTSPDGVIPGGAVNYGSLSEFAARSADDWESSIAYNASLPWGPGDGLLGSLFHGLESGQPLVKAIFAALADALGLGKVWDTVDHVVGAIGGFVKNITLNVKEAFEKLAKALGLNKVWGTLEDVVGDVAGVIKGITSNIVHAITGVVGGTLTNLTEFFGDAGQFITKIIAKIGQAITGITGATLTNLTEFFTDTGAFAVRIIKLIVENIAGVGKSTLAHLKEFFTTSGVGTMLGNVVAFLTDRLGLDFTGPVAFIVSVIQAIISRFTNSVQNARDFVGALWDAIVHWFQQKLAIDFTSLPNFVQSIIANIKSSLTGFFALVGDIAQKILEAFKKFAEKLGLSGVWDTLENVLESLGQWGNKIWSWIRNVIDGVFNAIQGVFMGVTDFADNTIHNMFVAVKRLFGLANDANNNANELMAKAAIPPVWGDWQASLTDDVCFAHTLIDGTTIPGASVPVLIPVTVNSDRPIEAIKLSMTAVTAVTSNIFVALYKVDRATGAAKMVADLGDCRTLLAAGTSNLKVLPLPQTMTASRGDLFYIGVLMWSSSAGTMTAMHSWSRATTVTTGTVPKSVGLALPPSSIVNWPATLANSEIVVGAKYWGALGATNPAAANTDPVFLADNFNRAASTTIGSSWQIRQGSIGIKKWHVGLFGADRTSAYPRTTSTRCIATSVARLASPDHEVQWTPYATEKNATAQTYGLARYDGNGRGVVVQVGWWNNAYQVVIATTNGSYDPNTSVQPATTRATVQVTDFYDYSPFKVVCRGNTVTVFCLNRAGALTQVLSWVDYGGAFPRDSTNTEVGLGVNGSTTAADDWSAKDLVE